MLVVPFKKATFTVADAAKAKALHDCVSLMYVWCAEYSAHHEMYGEPHPYLRHYWGDMDAMMAANYGLECDLALCHEGTMCSHYNDATQRFHCWGEVAEEGDLSDAECEELESSIDPGDQATLAAWLCHYDAVHEGVE